CILGLNAENSYLYEKSDAWLDKRLKNGLLEEVEQLLNSGVSGNWLMALGLEYRWLTLYLTHKMTLGDAVQRLKGDTHNFIRRQKTWFKQFPKIKIYDIKVKGYQQIIEKDLEKMLLGRE
ncbi:hypothetical protein HY024_05335, partial [Candidatus Curtissbacteria bacterium]|nr:hypothetical protein [Candidatus Curtissbacteria bacterium]